VEALVLLGEVALKQADFGPAEAALQRGLAAARALDNARWEANALNRLAELAIQQGAYQEGLNWALAQALPLARAVGDGTLAQSLYQIAGAYWSLGDLETAKPYADESLTVAQAGDGKTQVVLAINLLGILAAEQGDLELAAEYYRQALALARDAGNIRQEVNPLINLGDISYRADDYAAAQRYGLAALQKAREAGHPFAEAIVLANLSQATLKLGDLTAARGYARESLRLAVQQNNAPGMLFGVQVSAEILAAEGDRPQALQLLWLAHDHPAGDNPGRVEIQAILAALEAGEAESAAARAVAAKLELDEVVAEILTEGDI
jgi:tetratricopeptide (TPR) repeat protein